MESGEVLDVNVYGATGAGLSHKPMTRKPAPEVRGENEKLGCVLLNSDLTAEMADLATTG